MLVIILLKFGLDTFFSMDSIMNKTLKRCLYIRCYESKGDVMIELLKYQWFGSWINSMETQND